MFGEEMKKLLVSSCLLGKPVRYDGQSQNLLHPGLESLKQQGRIVSFCPEVAGGLPTPRAPAEISQGRVLTQDAHDVTAEFKAGAQQAFRVCKEQGIRFALLKESSPSCGRNYIYDGSHTGQKIRGMGLTAKLLSDNNIQVFSEQQLPALLAALAKV